MIRHWRSCAAPSRTIDAAIIVEFVGASDFAARAGARVLRAISRSGHGAAPVQPVRGERYAIVIDGAEVGDLGQGESGRWRVASGQHTVGVREVGSLAMLANTVWGWIFTFVVIDFVFYWYHRSQHRVRFMWCAHVVHHSSEHMNFGTALRQSSHVHASSGTFSRGGHMHIKCTRA